MKLMEEYLDYGKILGEMRIWKIGEKMRILKIIGEIVEKNSGTKKIVEMHGEII